MTRTIIAALALSLGLGTAALAQSSTTGADTSTSGSMTLPQGWQGDISSTFFSDPATGTLKSDEEIKSGWSKLSADQQAQVKSDCQSHTASASGTSGADKTTTSSTSTNSMASGGTSTDSTASAGGSADMTASLDKLCDAIQGM